MLDQFARGGLTPALAAGLAVTAYGLFQEPPQPPPAFSPGSQADSGDIDNNSSGGGGGGGGVSDRGGSTVEEKPVIGRLLPVTLDMVRAFFPPSGGPSTGFEAFTATRV